MASPLKGFPQALFWHRPELLLPKCAQNSLRYLSSQAAELGLVCEFGLKAESESERLGPAAEEGPCLVCSATLH